MSSVTDLARKQRRAVILAVGLSVAAVWIATSIGKWQIGVFLTAGILLGLANHVATEVLMQRTIEQHEQLTRRDVGVNALVRLLVVAAVGVALAVAFWPTGATTLFGLAIFHLIALVLTWAPLLKELNKA